MRLVRAEMLKLVRRRGLMAWCALLTVGAVIVAYAVMLALHAASPQRHGPAGGTHNLENAMAMLSGLGAVGALLLGTAAGSQDASAGVFRDLVVTGRPRTTLFAVRAPAALLTLAPLFLGAFGLAVAGCYAFAGHHPTPPAHAIGDLLAWSGSIVLVDLALAVGLTAFMSSRVAVGVLLAWTAIAARILLQVDSLGRARQAIDVAAAEHFAPLHAVAPRLAISGGVAAVVLVVWAVVPLAAGRWWTARADA